MCVTVTLENTEKLAYLHYCCVFLFGRERYLYQPLNTQDVALYDRMYSNQKQAAEKEQGESKSVLGNRENTGTG